MRKRYLVAAATALALAGGGAFAFADSEAPDRVGSERSSRLVTLPTGDAVSVSGNGSVVWHAAPGRQDEGYLLPPALDGSTDVIAIPLDRLDAIASGDEDPRRYNVSELLRSRQYDAAKAKRLSHKDYGRLVPVGPERGAAADGQKVTLTVTDRDGEPAEGYVAYINPETLETGEFDLDENGKGSVDLAPGRWDFHSSVLTGAGLVAGVTTAVVADAPVAITADGTEAKPIEYRTDRPATMSNQMVSPFTVAGKGEPFNIATYIKNEPAYVIPTSADQTGVGMELTSHLLGTDESDPYQYDLNFFDPDGIPADPTYTVADEELAKVERTFDGLVTTEPTDACNNVLRKGGTELAICTTNPVAWQTTHTQYLSAGDDLTWFANTAIGDVEDTEEYIDIESVEKHQPGETTAVTGSAPVAFNVGGKYEESVASRKGDTVSMYLPYLDNARTDEVIEDYHAVKGTAVLKRDGEELGKVKLTEPFAKFKLPKGDSGTYTLSAEVDRSAEVTPLATKTKVKWQFASKPTTKATPLDVSAVAFDADGVTAGYAEIGEAQDFTLEYRAQIGATDTKLKKLTFEVSYDKGETWKKIKVKVKGDKATGTLKHPEGAKLVSVRATATDTAGNKVTHSTVGSYGLK